jgi:hypothetical protein
MCIVSNWVAGYDFAGNWSVGYALPMSQTSFMMDICL